MGYPTAVKLRLSLLLTLVVFGGFIVFFVTREDVALPNIYRRTVVQSCQDHLINGLQCKDIVGICDDSDGRSICQCTCQAYATTASTAQCVDHLNKDVACADLPQFCKNSFADLVCPHFCGHCGSTAPPAKTTRTAGSITQSTHACEEDLLGNGLSCAYIPAVCSSRFGRFLCRSHCNGCVPTGSAVTPPPSTGNPGSCVDHVVGNVSCALLPGVCQDPLAKVVCCNHCYPNGLSTQSSNAAAHSGSCVDNVGHGLLCSDAKLSNICSRPYAAQLCPHHCHQCASAPASTAASQTCEDKVGLGLDCQYLKNRSFCAEDYSRLICRRTCGFCSDSTTTDSTRRSTTASVPDTTTPDCYDEVFGEDGCVKLAAQYPELCTSNTDGMHMCRKFCGICSVATSSGTTHATATSTCKPRISPGCQDLADFEVCNMYEFCNNTYAQVVCKKTCQICEDGCVDRLPNNVSCSDLYGPGKALTTLTDLCNDTLGSAVCEFTCGCKDFCPP